MINREVASPPSLFGCFRQVHPGDNDIHRAARENNIELLWRTLWDNEGTVYPVDILNADGNTALQIACVQGNLEIVQLLYGADADLDYSPGNISPLQYAQRQGHNNIVRIPLSPSWLRSDRQSTNTSCGRNYFYRHYYSYPEKNMELIWRQANTYSCKVC